jgi:hypothetical protein
MAWWEERSFDSSGWGHAEGPDDPTREGVAMYIGIGTLVVILVIVLILYLVRS